MFSELSILLNTYQNLDFSQRKVVLATVVGLSGSGYRRPGVKMLITDDGHWTGAVSGGCLEGDVLRKAREVMLDQKPKIIVYDTMDDSNELGISLGCNGIIDILLEPLFPHHQNNLLENLNQIPQENLVLIATVIKSENQSVSLGERIILSENQNPEINYQFPLFTEIIEKGFQILQTEKSQVVDFDDFTVFYEVLLPAVELVVFGAGYDAVALVNAARMIGFQVTVTDDCIVHIQPKRFQQANCLIYSPIADFSKNLKITRHSAAVLISHNYHYDKAVLQYLLTTEISYIGIMGPKKRGQKMIEELGYITETDLLRIHSPVGLDIGAETPEEIAVSIVAEIKAKFSTRNGKMLKFRHSGIHQENQEFI